MQQDIKCEESEAMRTQQGCNDGDVDDNFASAGHHVMANKGETGFDGLLYNVLLRLRPSLLAITNCILDEAHFWDVFSPGVPEILRRQKAFYKHLNISID